MYGLKKHAKQDKGGMIRGAGTGTSDDIKKNVPAGTYIMPADSTDRLGAKNLKNMGSPTPVNVSNGEFELSPEQVHSVGVQTLDAMKDQTHTPVNQPQLGFKPGQNKPELFFANGGDVPEWDTTDKAKAAALGGGAALYGATKVANTVPSIIGTAANTTPVTIGQMAKATAGAAWDGAKTLKSKPIPGVSNMGGASKLGAPGALATTAVDTATTPTEQYRERFGFQTDNPSFAGDLAMRALGAASDLGNNLTLGLAGKYYRDKQNATQEQISQPTPPATKSDPTSQAVEKAKANAAAKVAASTTPPTADISQQNTKQPISMLTDTSIQNTAQTTGNPYAIKQNGNSFSYADAGAAAQARANGVPELQSSGIKPVQGVRGIKEFMANTREMGPNEQQIQNAIAQREMNIGMQGFGGIARQPNAPQVRTPEQEAQLQSEIKRVSAPIAGSRGLTASQRNQINDLQMGYSNRENQRYTTDANNATAIQREAMGQAGQNLRTTMGEQGANYRTELGERGTNNRFAATNDLANREFNLTATEKGFGIRNSARVEKLYEQYDKAETDEQRQSIQEKINRYAGNKAESSNPYITVKRGEILDEKGNTIQPAGEVLFNRVTGETIDPLAQMPQLPPQAAIDDLKKDPSGAAEFDMLFGKGSAAKYL